MIADPGLDPAAVEIGGFFAQPLEEVWRALTVPDLLERWLMRPNRMIAAAGTDFVFVMPSHLENPIECEVLAFEPREQLTYSWACPRSECADRGTVYWTMRAQGRGTRLLLTHTGFDIGDRRQKMVRNAMERGWRNRFPRLREVLDR
ncbi:SRPBCC family protein [Nocardia yamanashiensis]|uniref:SRPBCC family protein n=1 Tax=Nocardia yamanashiensis TaxID=209247 RepID=UPI0009FD6B50|nr:SRPBCC domain-containing protein [Nocardia yamanashiensis]